MQRKYRPIETFEMATGCINSKKISCFVPRSKLIKTKVPKNFFGAFWSHYVRNLWKLLMSYRDHAPVWHYSFLKDGIFDTDAFRALLLSIFVFTIFFVWCIFYSESIRIHWWCTPIGMAKSFRRGESVEIWLAEINGLCLTKGTVYILGQ